MKNNDKLKALTDREQARLRLPVFYGSRENYLHGFREVVGNSIDEIINNFENGRIDISLNNNIISVQDTGRGMPYSQEGDEVLLFEKMFAGTKYEETDNITVGTNGLGNTVLNYTSKFFKATIYNKDEIITIGYTDGGQNKQMSIQKNNSKISHGTRIEFELDPECYTETIFQETELKDIVRRYAAVTPEIIFCFNGEEFHYNSITEYLSEQVDKPLFAPYSITKNISLEDGEKNNYDIVFTSNAEPLQETYLNNTFLLENGSIYNGFIKEMTNSLNTLAIEKKLHKKTKNNDSNFTEEDIKKVISFIVKVDSNRVEFQNQTKFSTKKVRYNAQTKATVKEMMNLFANAREKDFKELIKILDTVHQRTTRANKVDDAIKETLKKTATKKTLSVDKLVDCKEHNENAELFICEGDSAASSIVLARDNKTPTAVFPVRGKSKNIYGMSTGQALENEELKNITEILGCGMYNTLNNKDMTDLNKLRYGKVIIAADQDDDGWHVASLLITFFNRFMPKLIEEGHLYILQTPLYVYKFKDGSEEYLYSEEENDSFLKKNKKEVKSIHRLKGLGTSNPEDMNKYAIDKDKRIILQVERDDKTDEVLDLWMNKKNADKRKEELRK